jgi:hypothetical protein
MIVIEHAKQQSVVFVNMSLREGSKNNQDLQPGDKKEMINITLPILAYTI